MRKTAITAIGVLLVAGSAFQMTTASARHLREAHRAPAAAGEEFRNANNLIGGRASTFCSQEPGNSYNKQADYTGWSAWRQLGAWDSRNDCQ